MYCEPIIPIVYEFSGGAIGAFADGLPPGVNDSFVLRKQITSVRFTGPNINPNEIYDVVIDNISHTVTSTGGESPSDIVTDLIAVINAESLIVSASNNGSILILTGITDGQSFSVRTDKSALAQLTIDPPVLENGQVFYPSQELQLLIQLTLVKQVRVIQFQLLLLMVMGVRLILKIQP